MHSELAIAIAYFEFQFSQARRNALEKVLQVLSKADVQAILVVYSSTLFTPSINQRVQLIRIKQAGILWQKERFLNIALSNLSRQCKYLAWIDADLVLPDTGWINQLINAHKKYKLVQLFDAVDDVAEQKGQLVKKSISRNAIADFLLRYPRRQKEFFCSSGISMQLGLAPGFGWSVNRDAIESCGFPDFFILGSGDKAILAAAMGYYADYAEILGLNIFLKKKYLRWAKIFHQHIEKSVSYIKNPACHIVQGEYVNRRYGDRYTMVRDREFDPDEYLCINAEGAWDWRSTKIFAERIRQYFYDRED